MNYSSEKDRYLEKLNHCSGIKLAPGVLKTIPIECILVEADELFNIK